MKTLSERVARLESLLLGVIPTVPDKYLKLSRIRILVAQAHGLEVKSLVSNCRERRFAEARYKGFYLARKFTNAPLADIATTFQLKHHGTIINGLRRHHELCQLDASYRKHVETLERDLQMEFEAVNS